MNKGSHLFLFYFFVLQHSRRISPLCGEAVPRDGLLVPDPRFFRHLPLGPIANPFGQGVFRPPIILPVLEPDSAKSTHLGSEFVFEGNSTTNSFPQLGTVKQVSLNLILFPSQFVATQRNSNSKSSEVTYCSPSLHGPCRNSW